MRTTIVTRLMSTTRAGLARVAWVYLHHLNALLLSFVVQEGMELSEAPRMQAALAFAFAHACTRANMGEVLKHDGTAGVAF